MALDVAYRSVLVLELLQRIETERRVHISYVCLQKKKKEEKENLHQSFKRKREMGGTIEITSYIYYSSDRLQSADLV